MSAFVATAVLVSVALLTGRPLVSPLGMVLWVAVLVAHDVLVCEQRERIARRAAKGKTRAKPDRRGTHRSDRVF